MQQRATPISVAIKGTAGHRNWIKARKVRLEPLRVGGAPIVRFCNLDPGIDVVVRREIVSVAGGDAGRYYHVERHLDEGDERIEPTTNRAVFPLGLLRPMYFQVSCSVTSIP